MFGCRRWPDVYLHAELLKLWQLGSHEFNNSWLSVLTFSSPRGFTRQHSLPPCDGLLDRMFLVLPPWWLRRPSLSLSSNWITWWLTTCGCEVVGGVKLINTGSGTAPQPEEGLMLRRSCQNTRYPHFAHVKMSSGSEALRAVCVLQTVTYVREPRSCHFNRAGTQDQCATDALSWIVGKFGCFL